MRTKIKAPIYDVWYDIVNIDVVFKSHLQFIHSLSKDLDTDPETIILFEESLSILKEEYSELADDNLIRIEPVFSENFRILKEENYDDYMINNATHIKIGDDRFKILDREISEAGSLEVVVDHDIYNYLEFNRVNAVNNLIGLLYGNVKFSEIEEHAPTYMDSIKDKIEYYEELLSNHKNKKDTIVLEEVIMNEEEQKIFIKSMQDEMDKEAVMMKFKPIGIFVLIFMATFVIFVLSYIGG